MTLETTHQFKFRTAFYDLLVAGKTSGAALEHVLISRFPVDLDKVTQPCWIEMGNTTMDAEWDLLGAQSQEEIFTLLSRIVVAVSGSTPEMETSCINRAEAILAQVENIVRDNYKMPTMAGSIRDAILTQGETFPDYHTDGLVMYVPFTIRVTAQIRQV